MTQLNSKKPSKSKFTAADKAAVAQSVKHAKLVAESRVRARIVKTVHPTAVQRKRRKRLERNLARWLRYYMPDTFPDPWGSVHRACIKLLEECIRNGGSFAVALPRGGGKSAIGKGSCVMASLAGLRHYLVPIGATDGLANDYLEFIKSQLSGDNERIAEDYPDAVGFFVALGGSAHRANNQLDFQGKPTGIAWRTKGITFPRVLKPDRKTLYPYSGTRIECRGITSAMKGMAKTVRGGRIIRPDFVLPDDVQTEEDAESQTACAKIERKIVGTVLGLAGPRRRIACFMPCTVVCRNDVSDRFLSRDLHPEFQGKRHAMITAWPKEQDGLWARYAETRRDAEDDATGKHAATAFYMAHRKAMDRGGKTSWTSRIRAGEVSALETAENLLLEMGRVKFFAEMQQDPIPEGVTIYNLTPAIVRSRAVDRAVDVVPGWSHIIVATTDINPSYALTSAVVAFGEHQTAAVLRYGTQQMDIHEPVTEIEKRRLIYEALASHGENLSKLPCRPDHWFIDGGGGGAPEGLVQQLAFSAPRICGLQASCTFGRGWRQYRPTSRATHKVQVGEQLHRVIKRRDQQWIIYNSDYWREVAQRGWIGAPGAPGSCSLPIGNHGEFADQVCREQLRGKDEIGGRMVWVFDKAPGKNDYSDCMHMAYMGAAVMGIGTGASQRAPQQNKRKPTGVTVIPL